MTRIGTTIVVALIVLNSTVTIMAGSGLSDDLGVELAPGIDRIIDDTTTEAKNGFSADSGLGDTLFALFAAGLGAMRLMIHTTYAAPTLFINLGFPEYFVTAVFAPMYVIGFLELAYMATGRRTI